MLQVMQDSRLTDLQSLGSRNLSAVADRARSEFQTVPELVAKNTANARQGQSEFNYLKHGSEIPRPEKHHIPQVAERPVGRQPPLLYARLRSG